MYINSCRFNLYTNTYRNIQAKWFGCVCVQLSAGIEQSYLPYLSIWWYDSATLKRIVWASILQTTQNGICKKNNLSLFSIFYRELILVSKLSDNKSSSVCVLFTTNLGLIFREVVSSQINWFTMNGQLLKLFYIFLKALQSRLTENLT